MDVCYVGHLGYCCSHCLWGFCGPCFVMQYLVSFLVLLSSWSERKSWLFYFNFLAYVCCLAVFYGCSSRCCVLVCSVRLVISSHLDIEMEHILIPNFNPILTINFRFNLIYVSGGDYIWGISRWLLWLPFWILEYRIGNIYVALLCRIKFLSNPA